MTNREMVTMVGPNGERREVLRHVVEDCEERVHAAYEQGKEVGRINGSARLAEAQQELAMRTAQAEVYLDAAYRQIERLRAELAEERDRNPRMSR